MRIFKLHNDFNFVLGDIDNPYIYHSSIPTSYHPYKTELLPIVIQINNGGVIHVEMSVGDIIYIDTYSTQYKYCILNKIQRDGIIFEINEKSVVSIPFINVNPKTFEDITLKIQRDEKIDSILNI